MGRRVPTPREELEGPQEKSEAAGARDGSVAAW